MNLISDAKLVISANSLFARSGKNLFFARIYISRGDNTFAQSHTSYFMKKILFAFTLACISIATFAHEPNNNLGKPLYQIRREFPDAVNSGPTDDEGDLWISFDEDGFQKYTYYFVIKNGYVDSESLSVSSTGKIPNAEYIFFITTVKSFYTRGGWQFCDVDASILRAASVFNSERRLI